MSIRYSKLCRCDSNLLDYELVDAAGIFCAYVCERCEPEIRRKFNPVIFDENHPYASTGNEVDIE